MARKIQLARAKHILKDYREAQQRLLEVVQKNFGKGRSSGAEWRRLLVGRNIRPPQKMLVDAPSRQVLRAQLRRKHYSKMYISGDHHCFPENLQPQLRRDRRALARAHASREYKEFVILLGPGKDQNSGGNGR